MSESMQLLTVDVKVVLGPDFRSVVDRISTTVENSTQHVLGHGQLHGRSGEFDTCGRSINSGGTLEDLVDIDELPRLSKGMITRTWTMAFFPLTSRT